MIALPIPNATQRAIIEDSGEEGERPLWRAHAVAQSIGGEAVRDFSAFDVAFSAQAAMAGALCFVNSEIEAAAALARGAAGVVSSTAVSGPHILVADTADARTRLARAARARARGTIVATLGFADDDGVTHAVDGALARASRGTAWTADCAAGVDAGVEAALVRMPAAKTHAAFLLRDAQGAEILRPHLAVVGTGASREDGLRLCSALEPNGAAILPADHPDFPAWRAAALDAGAQVSGYGRKASADIRLVDAVRAPLGGWLVTAELMGQRLCYGLPDRRGDSCASLAVIGAMRAAGASLGAAALALRDDGGPSAGARMH